VLKASPQTDPLTISLRLLYCLILYQFLGYALEQINVRENAGAVRGKMRRADDRPLSYRQAIERVRSLWKDGVVEILPHAQERMRQRRLDRNDLASIIRYGRVVQHSKPGQGWRYKILGRAVDGAQTSCVVEINGSLIIVTVID
jgi:Domain of unknown function (DUF4258)